MKINNLESALNCSSLPFGAVRRGGVISPDGVLNLPYEHDSHDARDAESKRPIDREHASEYKTHAPYITRAREIL